MQVNQHYNEAKYLRRKDRAEAFQRPAAALLILPSQPAPGFAAGFDQAVVGGRPYCMTGLFTAQDGMDAQAFAADSVPQS